MIRKAEGFAHDLHHAAHYVVLCADGHATAFEYGRSEHLARGRETVDNVRTARKWYFSTAGRRAAERIEAWADEIELMRWTIRVCEAGMARMYEVSLAGRTENEIWAELHHENARSGGEWLETRLLASGRRTNPWFQESSDAICQAGDMLAFDTDMIGPYGYCADLSRSWTIGHVRQSSRQRRDCAAAVEQINHNVEVLCAGMSFAEFAERCWRIPERYHAR
jgi:hypothetical protein